MAATLSFKRSFSLNIFLNSEATFFALFQALLMRLFPCLNPRQSALFQHRILLALSFCAIMSFTFAAPAACMPICMSIAPVPASSFILFSFASKPCFKILQVFHACLACFVIFSLIHFFQTLIFQYCL